MRNSNHYNTTDRGCNLVAAEILGHWRPIVARAGGERAKRSLARLEALALGDQRGRNFAMCLTRAAWLCVRRCRDPRISRAELVALREALK